MARLIDKLANIQKTLKAPKNQFNNFGKYHYRSCEDILEGVKPLLIDCVLTLSDEIVQMGNRHYVRCTAVFGDDNGKISVTAYAREEEDKKGMDGAQITGAASSYARKYALNGLFLIDDTKDADSTNTHNKEDKADKGQEKPKEASPDASQSKSEPQQVIAVIDEIEIKTGEKEGKVWTKYGIKADGKIYGTFDKKIADAAEFWKGQQAKITFETKGKYLTCLAVGEPE